MSETAFYFLYPTLLPIVVDFELIVQFRLLKWVAFKLFYVNGILLSSCLQGRLVAGSEAARKLGHRRVGRKG